MPTVNRYLQKAALKASSPLSVDSKTQDKCQRNVRSQLNFGLFVSCQLIPAEVRRLNQLNLTSFKLNATFAVSIRE